MKTKLPVWALPAVAFAAALLIVGFFWVGMGRLTPNPGPDKEVRPGMYNLRDEMSKSAQRTPTRQTP